MCVCVCMLKYIIKSKKIKCYDTETYKYMLCIGFVRKINYGNVA